MMRDLLLPTTDAGVAVQAVIAAVLFGALLVRTRDEPDLRLLVAGGMVFVAGLFMLRAAH
jgi:hypothetical protein